MADSRQTDSIRRADGKSAEDRALDTFADLMIERISEINTDWKKPWFDTNSFLMPRNLSGRAYNGMNSFMLLLHTAKEKYELPVFLTYNQIAYTLNGKSKIQETEDNKPIVDLTPKDGEESKYVHINKGEKSFPVFLTLPMVKNKETHEIIPINEYNNMSDEEREKYYVKASSRVYNVFNIGQTNLKEARPELYAKIEKKFKEIDGQGREPQEEGKMFKFEPLDRMIKENKWICPISEIENQGAYFSPAKNEIVVPPKKNFADGESFYGNLLHEMVHSTGTETALNRFANKTDNARTDYAREELVAEMGAAVTAHKYGFDKHLKDDSAAYLKSWLSALKEDPSFLKTTLDDVKKASNFISNRIEQVKLDIREIETISVDVNNDGIDDISISSAIPDKKQGMNEPKEQQREQVAVPAAVAKAEPASEVHVGHRMR